jgi:hypothetical protein
VVVRGADDDTDRLSSRVDLCRITHNHDLLIDTSSATLSAYQVCAHIGLGPAVTQLLDSLPSFSSLGACRPLCWLLANFLTFDSSIHPLCVCVCVCVEPSPYYSSMLHHSHPLEPPPQGLLSHVWHHRNAHSVPRGRSRKDTSSHSTQSCLKTRSSSIEGSRMAMAPERGILNLRIIDRQETICNRGMGLVHFYSMGLTIAKHIILTPTLPPTLLLPSGYPATL